MKGGTFLFEQPRVAALVELFLGLSIRENTLSAETRLVSRREVWGFGSSHRQFDWIAGGVGGEALY